MPLDEIKPRTNVVPFHALETTVVGTESLGGVEEHVGLLPVNNPVKGGVDLLSLVFVQRDTQLLDQGVSLGINERDMVATPFLLARL